MLARIALTLMLLTPLHAHAQADAATHDDGEDTSDDDRARDEAYRAALASLSDDAPEDDIHLRLELTMGFAGGYGRYADLGLGQSTLPAGAIDGGSVSGAAMAGLRYDLRLVVAFVRMTVGGDLLWGLFSSSAERMVSGVRVRDERLFDGALRFGLGLEANVEGVRLFADVLGTVHFVENVLFFDGTAVGTTSTAFAPGARIGVRVPVVSHFFVQASIDASPFGPTWIGGDISVGGAIE